MRQKVEYRDGINNSDWMVVLWKFTVIALSLIPSCMSLRTPNINGLCSKSGTSSNYASLAFVVTRPVETCCKSLPNKQQQELGDLSLEENDDQNDPLLKPSNKRRRVKRSTQKGEKRQKSSSGVEIELLNTSSSRVIGKSNTNPYKLPLDKEEQWTFFYDMLREYNRKHNQTVTAIPAGPAVHQSLLRNWCADQRKSYMKTLGVLDIGQRANWGTSYLTWQKKKLLDEAGFYWGHFNHTMDDEYIFSEDFQSIVRAKYKDWLWNPFYDKLVAYYKRHNHTNVPHNYTDQLLAAWTSQQRLLYNHQSTLKNDNDDTITTPSSSDNNIVMPRRRMNKLDQINFNWNWSDENDTFRNLNWTTLEAASDKLFLNEEGKPDFDNMLPFDALILENLDRNDPNFPPSLGIIDINSQLQKKKSVRVVPWAQRLRQLKEFRKENGHCDVPLDYRKVAGLGAWVKKQQKNHKLSPRSRYQLQKLGFTFHFD